MTDAESPAPRSDKWHNYPDCTPDSGDAICLSAPTARHSCVKTTTTLAFEGHGQAHIARGDIVIMPGVGSHLLHLFIETRAGWLPEKSDTKVPFALNGEIHLDSPGPKWVASLLPQALAFREYWMNEKLSWSLTDDQLIAIERTRGGDGLSLQFDLQAALLQQDSRDYPIAETQFCVRIPGEQWQRILDQAGTEVGVVLRIPSPLTDPGVLARPDLPEEERASLSRAVARLREARTELRDGRWESCVVKCRHVLETLRQLVDIPSENSVDATAKKHRNPDQRWAAIFHAVMSLLNMAHHDDEITMNHRWDRVEAESVLAHTAALLRKYAPANSGM